MFALSAAAMVGGCGRRRVDPLASGVIALSVPNANAEITTVHYDVGGNGFSRSGDIDVSSVAATPSVLITGVPAGDGFVVTLSARSTDDRTTCRGSAPVTVIAQGTTPLAVTLECRTVSHTGSVTVNGGFNSCPMLVSLTASPAAVTVGAQETIDLVASAADPDGNPLTFVWSAAAGTFDNPAATATAYRCAGPGSVPITVSVSDGSCEDQVTATLICLPFCANKPSGTACDDEDACTRRDVCQGGECAGTDPVVCAALDQCHLPGLCNKADGLCSNPVAPEGVVCQLPSATAACAGGACAVTSCDAGAGNCNTVAMDGCETPLSTNTDCGACGRSCGGGTACESALCLSPPPGNVTAVAGGWKVTLSWTASAGATGYEVWRGASEGGPFQVLGNTIGLRFMDLTVASGAPSFYRVHALNSDGRGRPSPAASATPLPRQLCVNSNSQHTVFVYQSGMTTPVRTLGGTINALGFPTAVASSLTRDELFVMRRGGAIDVFPLHASGPIPPVRVLSGAVPAGILFGLDVDDGAELFAADFSPGGRLMALNVATGAVTRIITGRLTQLGNPPGVLMDRARGEVLISTAGLDVPAAFPRIQAYDITGGDGDIAPKRVLGTPGNTSVGRWALAMDRQRDQLYTTCNCDNRITVFDRAASGAAAPLRTLELPSPVVAVYALLMDEGADTVWVVARTGTSTQVLMEVPRGGNGIVAGTQPAIPLGAVGFLARCN